eukprot:sb/3468626/
MIIADIVGAPNYQSLISPLQAMCVGKSDDQADLMIRKQLHESIRLTSETKLHWAIHIRLFAKSNPRVQLPGQCSTSDKRERFGLDRIYCPVLSCPVLSCPVLSCPVLSCPVLSCPVLSCPVLSCPVLSCPVLSCPVLSCPVLSCPVLSCPVLSCPVLSCPVLSCPVLSCPVLSCPVLSCPVLSCPVLSCPVLSCPVLSCPVPSFSLPPKEYVLQQIYLTYPIQQSKYTRENKNSKNRLKTNKNMWHKFKHNRS